MKYLFGTKFSLFDLMVVAVQAIGYSVFIGVGIATVGAFISTVIAGRVE